MYGKNCRPAKPIGSLAEAGSCYEEAKPIGSLAEAEFESELPNLDSSQSTPVSELVGVV